MGRQEATRQTCLFFHRTGRDDQCASGNQQRVRRKKWEGRKKQFMGEGLKQEGGGGSAGGCRPEWEANQPSWGLESGESGDAVAGSMTVQAGTSTVAQTFRLARDHRAGSKPAPQSLGVPGAPPSPLAL